MIIILMMWLALINIGAFALYQLDKGAARAGRWRISDRYLLTAAMVGGSLGSLIGITLMRHKTRRKGFVIRVKLIFIVQIIALAAVLYPVTRNMILDAFMGLDIQSYMGAGGR